MSEIKVKLLSHWGPGDQRVCESAWTSTYDRDKFETKTEEQIDKVINIVVGQGHGTPLESTWLEFYLEIPIFIERQLDKYRMTQQYQDIQIDNNLKEQLNTLEKEADELDASCGTDDYPCGKVAGMSNVIETIRNNVHIETSYQLAPMGRDNITQNELSGRYRTIPNRFIEMPDDVTDIMCKAQWGPYPEGYTGDDANAVQAEWKLRLDTQYKQYENELAELKKGLDQKRITQSEYKRAREFLRGILGTAFITHMKLVLNLRAFENILRERLAPDAQPEIQEVAKLMLSEVINANVAPKVIEKMIETNGWVL